MKKTITTLLLLSSITLSAQSIEDRVKKQIDSVTLTAGNWDYNGERRYILDGHEHIDSGLVLRFDTSKKEDKNKAILKAIESYMIDDRTKTKSFLGFYEWLKCNEY